MKKSVRSLVLASILSLVAIGLVPVASAQVAMQTITSSGPLNNIFLGNELGCQISHVNDQAYEFYPPSVAPGDCGTFAFVDGTLFSPNFPGHGPTATGGLGAITPHTSVSQSAVTGAGSSASPYAVTTTVTAGPLRIVQIDSYVPGTEFYRTDIEVRNTASGAKAVILYHALDCYLAGSDRGFGLVDQAARAPGCRESTNGQPGNRIEQLVPITGGNAYYEDSFADVWSWIGTHQAFNNTCECTVEQDNGIGVSWNLNLRAGATAKRSLITTFSPTGQQALSLDKTADDSNVAPSASTGYTVTASNANGGTVSLNSITDTLPQGFTYTPGSTTGVTTADPTVTGQTLTWTGQFSVPSTASSGSMITLLHFGVTASSTNGIFFNEVTGDAGTFPVAPSGPTARIIVGGSTCTLNGTAGNDILDGEAGNDELNSEGGGERWTEAPATTSCSRGSATRSSVEGPATTN